MAVKVVGLGAGGHSKVLIEALRVSGAHYEIIGLLDANLQLKGKAILGVPVLGTDVCLTDLQRDGLRHFFVSVGGVGHSSVRQRLYELTIARGLIPIQIIHPNALVSVSARIGSGTTVLARAVVNSCAVLGANNIINTGAIVEHDCELGDHVHVATGAQLASGVKVGNGAHIGIGATIKQGIVVGEGAVVGAGAAVVKDVPAHTVVVGVPARPLREQL